MSFYVVVLAIQMVFWILCCCGLLVAVYFGARGSVAGCGWCLLGSGVVGAMAFSLSLGGQQ